MTLNIRRTVLFGGVAAAALVLTGCHYVGGGTVTSETGHGQASFSFNLQCTPGTHVQKGTLTYVDNPAHVLLRGTVDQTPNSDVCASNSDFTEGDFYGTYSALNGAGGGTFSLNVTPGNTGRGGSPTFDLELDGGPYSGFENSGPLIAGQVTTIGGPSA